MPADATGSTTQPEGSKGETPEYVTKADLAAMFTDLEGKFGKLVNGATTNHLSREMKKLGLTPDLVAAIAKLTAPPKPEGEGEGGDGGDADAEPPKPAKTKGKPPEASAQAQSVDFEALLKKQAAEMEANFSKRLKSVEEATTKKLTEERQKREAAERAQVELRGTTVARAVLSKHVVPDAADLAFDALKARGHLFIAEDGTPYYRATPTDEDGQVPFAEGVTEFLKTPGAKVFVPAPQQPKPGNKLPATPPRPPANGGHSTAPTPESIDAAVHARTGTSLANLLLTPGMTLPATDS